MSVSPILLNDKDGSAFSQSAATNGSSHKVVSFAPWLWNSGTPIAVDDANAFPVKPGSSVVFPVAQSGTWTVNLGTLNGAATAANQSTLITSIGAPSDAAATSTSGTFNQTQILKAIFTQVKDLGVQVQDATAISLLSDIADGLTAPAVYEETPVSILATYNDGDPNPIATSNPLPVVNASLPLPSGAATENTLALIFNRLAKVISDANFFNVSIAEDLQSPAYYDPTSTAYTSVSAGEKLFQVPLGENWFVRMIYAELTTDSTVGNRHLSVRFESPAPASAVHGVARCPIAQAASVTGRRYTFGQGLQNSAAAIGSTVSDVAVAIPEVYLSPGSIVRVRDPEAIGAADAVNNFRIYVVRKSILDYETETLNFFLRVTGSYSSTEKKWLDSYIKALKYSTNGDIFSQMDALYVFGFGKTVADAYLNICSSNYTITPFANGGTPQLTVRRGFNCQFGTLNTGINPSSTSGLKLTLNSASIGLWNLTEAQSNHNMGAIDNSDNRLFMRIRSGVNETLWRVNSQGFNFITGRTTSVGMHGTSRTASATSAYYFNGSSIASGSDGSNTLPNAIIHVGGTGNQAGGVSEFGGRIYAMAWVGAGLTAAQNSTLYSATLALLNNWGGAT